MFIFPTERLSVFRLTTVSKRETEIVGGGGVRSSQDFHVKDAPRMPPPFQNLSLFYRLPR